MILMPITSYSQPSVEGREIPALELLEFLGEWETDWGVWEDPQQFTDDSFEQLLDDNAGLAPAYGNE